jgi:hypothetical protein
LEALVQLVEDSLCVQLKSFDLAKKGTKVLYEVVVHW